MAQQFWVLAAPAEGLALSLYPMVYGSLPFETPGPGDLMASSDFCKHHIHMRDTNIHAAKMPIHIPLFIYFLQGGGWREPTP